LRRYKKLNEAMKMAKDVVAFLEQQVKDLSPSGQQGDRPVSSPPAPPPAISSVSKSVAEAIAPSSSEIRPNRPLEGRTFVITGKLDALSFDQAKSLIEAAGGQINEHPSSQTSYVVVGRNPGKKLIKAEKYSTPQLTEAELLALLEV
jgi:NAD-dependent DNA ligase